MLALDQFVLWVPADTPYQTAKDYIEAVKAGEDKKFKMGGTGSKQEDQIITVALEQQTGNKKFTYIPYQGGGAVAVQLVGKHVELLGQQSDRGRRSNGRLARSGRCASSTASAAPTRQKSRQTWPGATFRPARSRDCRSSTRCCAASSCRGGATPEQVAFYVDLFKKVQATDEWKKFMEDGAFNQTFMTGDDFRKWVEAAEKTHYDLMKEANFLAAGR